MAAIAIPIAQPSIMRPAAVYVALFGGIGAFFPFFPVYLGSLGLSLGTVGLLIALHALVSLLAAPAWGALADRRSDVRGPLLVAGVASAGAAPVLAVAHGPILIAVGISLLAATSAGMIPLVDSRTIQLHAGDRDRYGQARAAGSAAFIVMAISTGAVFELTGPSGIFLIYGPLLLLTGLAAWALLGSGVDAEVADRTQKERRVSLRPNASLLAVLVSPRLGAFLAGSMLVWTAVAIVSSFAPIYVTALGGEARIVGLLFSLGAAVEVPLMFLFPAFARRFGASRLIVLGAVAFAVRAAAWAAAPSPEVVLAAAPLGGVGFAFFYVGTVTYIAGAVPRSVQATAQGIFTATAFMVGVVLGSIIGGQLAGALTLPGLFALAALGTWFGAVVIWWSSRSPEPLIAGAR